MSENQTTENLPNKEWHPALRWLAIIPSMIGVYLGVVLLNIVTTFIFEIFGRKASEDDFSIMPLIYTAVGGYAMVTVAHSLAPSGKRGVAIVAALVCVGIGVMSLMGREGPFVGYLIDIAMLGGAGFAGFQALRGDEPSMKGL